MPRVTRTVERETDVLVQWFGTPALLLREPRRISADDFAGSMSRRANEHAGWLFAAEESADKRGAPLMPPWTRP
jgi:predicted neutral ceramidase superfamily lipid hydrolase